MHPALIAIVALLSVSLVLLAVWFAVVSVGASRAKKQFKLTLKAVPETCDRKLVVLGLAQNIQDKFEDLQNFVIKLKSAFVKCQIYIGENGSKDRSAELLNSKQPSWWTVVKLDHVVPEDGGRIGKMAALRNELQRIVFEQNPEDDFTLCVVDWDIPFELSFIHEWPKCIELLETNKDVAAVTGIGLLKHPFVPVPCFYDTFAYREKKGDKCKSNSTRDWLRMAFKYGKVDSSFVERVGNNFGGVAMYRSEEARKAKYLSRDEDGGVVCEHVTYQNQIKGDVIMSGALLHLSEHCSQRAVIKKNKKAEKRKKKKRKESGETLIDANRDVEAPAVH
jgi:hypothetical protein